MESISILVSYIVYYPLYYHQPQALSFSPLPPTPSSITFIIPHPSCIFTRMTLFEYAALRIPFSYQISSVKLWLCRSKCIDASCCMTIRRCSKVCGVKRSFSLFLLDRPWDFGKHVPLGIWYDDCDYSTVHLGQGKAAPWAFSGSSKVWLSEKEVDRRNISGRERVKMPCFRI